MNTSQLIVTVPIAVLYPMFLSKGYDYFSKIDETKEECDKLRDQKYGLYDKTYGQNESSALNDMIKKCDDKLIKLKDVKFMWMVALAVLSVILSAIFSEHKEAACGIGMGAIMLLIYNILVNWYTMYEGTKLLIIGASLIVLLVSSVKYFNFVQKID